MSGREKQTMDIVMCAKFSLVGERRMISFVRSLRAGSSLLWTPALRPFKLVQCASPERGGDLIGVRVWCERYVGCRMESRLEQLVRYF